MTADATPDVRRLLTVLEASARFYADRLTDSFVAQRWMTGRGWDNLITPGTEATRWRPGYAPRAWTALSDHLRGLGHSETDIVETGLGLVTRRGTTVDRFRNRLVLPLVDHRGVIGFVGRALPGSGDEAPKWLNPPHTVLYDKSRHLFGLTQNAEHWAADQQPVLVEGPSDAIAVGLAGRSAIALCGTSLTAEHVHALARAVDPSRGLIIAFDADTAGRAAVDRAWTRLVGRPGVRVAEFRGGRDPGTFAATHEDEELLMALRTARPLIEVVVDHRLEGWSNVLDSVGGQVEAARHVAALLAQDFSAIEPTIAYLCNRLEKTAIDVRSVIRDELALGRMLSAGPPVCQPPGFGDRAPQAGRRPPRPPPRRNL